MLEAPLPRADLGRAGLIGLLLVQVLIGYKWLMRD
jgi:hypothetical protein